MTVWVDNAWLSLLFAGLTLILLIVPTLVARSRRGGGWGIPPGAARLLAVLYGVALVVYTQFPTPSGDAGTWCSAHSVRHNLVPLDFLRMVVHRTGSLSIALALHDVYLLQVVLNLLLFVPLGLLLRRWVVRSVGSAVFIGLGVSVVIEVLQGTGLLGVYPCPYRIADVDDVLVNTTGTALGALLVRAFEWRRHGIDSLTHRERTPRRVRSWRRWVGMLLDVIAGVVVAVLVQAASRGLVLAVPATRTVVQGHTGLVVTLVASLLTALLAVSLLPAVSEGGATLGQTVMLLAPRWLTGGGRGLTRGTAARRVVRAVAVPGPLLVALVASQVWPEWAQWIQLPGLVWVLVAVVMVPPTLTHRSLSGVLTGAVFVDARDPVAGGPTHGGPVLLDECHRERLGLVSGVPGDR